MGRIAVVDGHEGAGKSTLILRMLESNRSRSIQVTRCVPKPGSGPWREVHATAPGASGHSELRKWLDAGAVYAGLLTYDPAEIDIESLLMESEDGFGDCDEWMVEAENVSNPRAYCSVYVLRPLSESAALVETVDRVVDHIPLEKYLRLTAADSMPDEPAVPDGDVVEEEVLDIPFDSDFPENLAKAGVDLSESEADRLRTLLRDGIPVWSKRPELRPECSRLPAAEVVIINLHNENERGRAEATRRKILGLFGDWNLIYQLNFRSPDGRPGVYIANIQEACDPGTRKALAQIKRKLRGRSS